MIFIPTLLIISLLAFILSIQAPGDPLDRLATVQETGGDMAGPSTNTRQEQERWRKQLGLDLPVFYFSLSNAATPDTLYKQFNKPLHTASERLIHAYGNWPEIDTWQKELQTAIKVAASLNNAITAATDSMRGCSAVDTISNVYFELQNTLVAYDPLRIESSMHKIDGMLSRREFLSPLLPQWNTTKKAWYAIEENATPLKNYIPSIRWHAYNQYHRWIFGDGNWITGKGAKECRGIIRGDFGYSYSTKQPVGDVIGERLTWSLWLTLVSVLLAYMISIPIGIRAAAKKDSLFDRTSSVILFVLYSMPTFWVATLLLMTFANPLAMQIFPASGVGPVTGIPADASIWETFKLRLPYLVLPTIAYTYAQLAFLSRITRVATLEVVAQDFIRTARAKGLSENKVIYKHAFRNALLPIITVFSNIFPLAIGGSVILETIFSIPGMGQMIFQAILSKDYPVIISVFTLTGILTLVGYLVADILYAIADPRISYSKK